MAQIVENYISFETAKLLKEKGFDVDECEVHYDPLDHTQYEITLQMAMKWLREVHHIHIVANVDVSSPSFFIDINKKDYDGWISANDDTSMVYTGETIFTKNFHKYEEACEAAIKYCLDNLI